MTRSIRMGLREANQRFSAAIKAVKAGKDVILTDRGKPIAVIKRLAHAASVEQRVRDLEAVGLLQAATRRGVAGAKAWGYFDTSVLVKR